MSEHLLCRDHLYNRTWNLGEDELRGGNEKKNLDMLRNNII
jgi:hypothetical protein